MRTTRGFPRRPAIALAVCLTLALAVPCGAYKIAAETLSCGGAPSASATYKSHDTIGQGAIGPVAEGTTTRSYDGFWLTLPSINVPVDGSFYADLSDEGAVVLRWSISSLSDVVSLNIYRATAEEGPYERLNEEELPPSSPGRYEDTTVWPDTEFWYELRALLADGTEDAVAGSPYMIKTGGKLVLALYPAHPNPFRGATTIRFDIPDHMGPVKLTLYNIRGQVVRELVDAPLERGRYEWPWDGLDGRGSKVAAGVYLAMLEVDDRVKRQKLMLLK